MKRLSEILLLCCVVVLLMGADATQARFENLGGKIMCTCSCGQMLLKCNHVGCPNSAKMIGQLHAQVAQQSDDEKVLQWFRETWGVTAVVEPATHGFELLVWVVPPVVAALFLALVIVIIMVWRSRVPATLPADRVPDPHLDALRARARQETEI
ncbi:MAG: cytochrome c-type biogenesis protein CcmH [Acidobacteriia bacterium]|nr:cytochrome c-type biogenesis protein CcmH [Terriglobia bacterium]